MRDRHQPRDEFVARLEQEIRRGAERHPERSATMRWVPQTPGRAALAVMVLVALSMGAGAAVTAAAYQAQTNEHRDLLIAAYGSRMTLARQRVALAADALREAERQAQIGLVSADAAREARTKLVEAESQMKILELQMEEVGLTGREPLDEVTAPLVAGRDFVGERWRAQMDVPLAAMALEQSRLRASERRVDIGVAGPEDVEVIRNRVVELEAALDAARRRVEVRRQFIGGLTGGPHADLRVLEIDAEQRRSVVTPKLATARRNVERLQALVDIGRATTVQFKEAQLKLLELEAELVRADLDLTLVRRQLAQ
jgi:outer membrane protein TolC